MSTSNPTYTHDAPLVSVVMPVYNCEKYVKSALDSVLNQDYRNLEIIVINDGSTDRSREIILSIKDDRIRFYDNEENKGIVYSRNRGLDLTTGEFTAIMDSDDLLHPSKIGKQVEFFKSNPEYGLCATFFQRIGPDGSKLSENRKPANEQDARAHLILENFFCHSSIMFPTGLVQSFRFNNVYNLIEDYELFYRISRIYKIGIIPEILTSYRVHPNNISKLKREEMLNKIRILNSTIMEDIGLSCNDDELEMHANFLYYNSAAFGSNPKMRKLKIWVEKLLRHLEEMPDYNTSLNREIILEKWMVVCRNNKKFGSLLLSSLVFRYPVAHLHILRNKLLSNQHKTQIAA